MSRTGWAALLIAALLLAVFALVYRPGAAPVASPGDAADRGEVAPVAGGAPPPPEPAPRESAEPLTEAQLAMRALSEPQRHSIFRLEIRDRGYDCDELTSSPEVGVGVAAWRVDCGFAQAYLVGVEADGALFVEPMPYSEGSPGGTPPIRRVEPGDGDVSPPPR